MKTDAMNIMKHIFVTLNIAYDLHENLRTVKEVGA